MGPSLVSLAAVRGRSPSSPPSTRSASSAAASSTSTATASRRTSSTTTPPTDGRDRARAPRPGAGVEHVPRHGTYAWRGLLARKAALAWRSRPTGSCTSTPTRSGCRRGPARRWPRRSSGSATGYNAVRFQELTFVPTQEHPDHDHARFRETMRWYYPFSSGRLDQVKAWRRQPRAGRPRLERRPRRRLSRAAASARSRSPCSTTSS